ncbi:MAG: glycosyltransferase [Humidesulfovibrio sp.]|nr:glycosyltransferase [Humidesulfovibrio sp.]
MRLLLSIPSLALGGAERQFAALASGLAARGHDVLAVTLGRGGPLAESLGRARLVELGKASRLDNPLVALGLARLLRREAPAVHYAFLPSCCVLGALLAPFFPATRLVLGVRASNVAGLGLAGRLLHWLEARLSRRAALVIANSQVGLRHCLERGFPAARAQVVPNGIDAERFRPERALGAELRRAWGAGDEDRLIGLVARLDPMKGHAIFLAAAARLARQRPEARFVCVGGGPADYAAFLRDQARALGLDTRLVWAGERPNMPAVYNALDFVCLSSTYGEGFPNVLGEAMACGVPCVATDVGDATLVLGGTGVVVRPGDAMALAEGLAEMLERLGCGDVGLGMACRAHVLAEFSTPRMVLATEVLLRGL